MNKLELGQKIRALRKERKQTLETLAEAADIDAGGDRRSALHSGNDDTTSEKAEK